MAEHQPTHSPGRLTPARRRVLDQLLDQALDLEPEARESFVLHCSERAPRLAAWLWRLLAATTAPGEFLERSARHLVDDALENRQRRSAVPLPAGSRLGPWRLLEPVGAGGMGEVYRAERADGAFEMAVAIKVIRSARKDLAELLTAERQAMARLNHGSIARLIDGGMTDDGRPYLVMEWVEGVTLCQWIDQADPDVTRLLDLFRDACMAVSAAHRQLIVHGDIKPSNLLVTDDGSARLVDFGVARLLDAGFRQDLPGALTPGFAAPEQIAGGVLTTAADVYSLGALLHWLVYGRSPSATTGDKPLDKWRTYSRLRDVLAIIRQATAAQPEARYVTVNAMLIELRRVHQNRPIRARVPGPLERLVLWSRRHTVGAVLGVVALASVLIGMSVTVYQARVVALERDVARTEAALSEAVRDHLIFLFREVGSLADDGGELTAREMLDRTAQVAGEWLSEEPEIQQQVLLVLGEIMISLHDYSSAEPILASFIDLDDEHVSPVLRSMAYRDMAQVYHRQGRVEEGFEAVETSLNILKDFPGSHPARLSDVLQIRGRLHRDLGRWDEAVADLRRARDLAMAVSTGPRPLMARAENNLGTTLLIAGRLEEASRHLEAAEALWFALERGDSSDALAVMSNLAITLDRLGRTTEAEQRLRKVIQVRGEKYGESGAMAAARINLGRLLTVRGAYEEAADQLERSLDVAGRFVGERSPDYAAALIGLGELARARGDAHQALEYFEQSAEIMLERLGEMHPYSIQAGLEVIRTRDALDEEFEGRGYEQVIDRARAMGGATRMILATALCDYAIWAIDKGRYKTASAAAGECLETREELGLGGWRITEARAAKMLAGLLSGSGSVSETQLVREIDRLAEQTHHGHRLVEKANGHEVADLGLPGDG